MKKKEMKMTIISWMKSLY